MSHETLQQMTPAARAGLLMAAGREELARGRPAEAVAALAEAAHLAPVAPAEARCELLALLGAALAAQGDLPQAYSCATELLRLSPPEAPPHHARAMAILSSVCGQLGQHQEAMSWAERGAALAYIGGDRVGWAALELRCAVSAVELGEELRADDPARAESLLERALLAGGRVVASGAAPALNQAIAQAALAHANILLGHIAAAFDHSVQVEPLLAGVSAPALRCYGQVLAARIGWHHGERGSAIARMRDAWRCLDAMGERGLAAGAARALVAAYRELGDHAAALEMLQYAADGEARLRRRQARLQRLIALLHGPPPDTPGQIQGAPLIELLREQIAARETAEAANSAKSAFLGHMSHELRTPLNAIINFTLFLSKDRYGSLTPAQQELQQRVVANANHLLGLINDLLDISRIEAGRFELYREVVELPPLLHSAVATVQGLIRDRGLTLRVELPAPLPAVRIDQARVRQVLLNLLSNAAKFTRQGEIVLRAAVVGDEVKVDVIDSGIGIADEHLAMIFEEFGQVARSQGSEHQGAGLGLPICRRIIHQHGGKIWVLSTPGAGSTFSFTLPLAAPPLSAEGSPVPALDDAALDAPPLEALLELQHLARMGDLLSMANSLARFEARYPTFVQHLRALIRQFEDRAILEVIAQAVARATT